MSNVSVTLLTTNNSYTYTGTQAPSDAYYGFTDGLHTVSVDVASFTGRIFIEGSLATTPASTDWFTISLDPINSYLEYSNQTAIEGFTFMGNFMYIRARVQRSHLSGPPALNTLGHVNKILLNV